jgi:hypothetical protein
MLANNGHVLARSLGQVLVLPAGPVLSVPIHRLVGGVLRLLLQDRNMLCLHGDVQQRARIVGWSRQQARQRLCYGAVPPYACAGQLRMVLCDALQLDRPMSRHPREVDRLLHHALTDVSRVVVLDQAQHLHAAGFAYARYVSEHVGAQVILVASAA